MDATEIDPNKGTHIKDGDSHESGHTSNSTRGHVASNRGREGVTWEPKQQLLDCYTVQDLHSDRETAYPILLKFRT